MISQLPGFGWSGRVVPLRPARAPDAHEGIRTRSSREAAPELTVRVVVCWSGKPVVWRQVMPFSCQRTSEGMKRFTRRLRSPRV